MGGFTQFFIEMAVMQDLEEPLKFLKHNYTMKMQEFNEELQNLKTTNKDSPRIKEIEAAKKLKRKEMKLIGKYILRDEDYQRRKKANALREKKRNRKKHHGNSINKIKDKKEDSMKK